MGRMGVKRIMAFFRNEAVSLHYLVRGHGEPLAPRTRWVRDTPARAQALLSTIQGSQIASQVTQAVS